MLFRMKTLCNFIIALVLLVPSFAFGQKTPGESCPLNAGATIASITASGATQLIPVPTTPGSAPIYINNVATFNTANAPSIHVCSVNIRVTQGATPANFGLVTGTGVNCATNQVNLTPQWIGTATSTDTFSFLFGPGNALIAPKGTAVCAKFSAAPTGALALITYAVF